jgi:hypothetical protein
MNLILLSMNVIRLFPTISSIGQVQKVYLQSWEIEVNFYEEQAMLGMLQRWIIL